MAHLTKKKLRQREQNNKKRAMFTADMNLGTRTCGHPARVYALEEAFNKSWKGEY